MLAVNKRALERSRSFSVPMLVAMFIYVITHLRKDDHALTFQRMYFIISIYSSTVLIVFVLVLIYSSTVDFLS